MKDTTLGQMMALERCRLYLAQICAITYVLKGQESSNILLSRQLYELVHKIQDDFLVLERSLSPSDFVKKSTKG